MRLLTRTLLAGLLFAGLGASTALAQDQADFQAKYEAKKAESWFTDNGWTDDYDAARAKAKETGKPILAYFTRSYAP